MKTRTFNVIFHCTPSMLIKLIFFGRKEVRLLYIGVTGFRSHTSPTIFAPILCLPCLCYAHYAYYACTLPTTVLCLYHAYYSCTMPTMPVPCPLYLCYAYYAFTMLAPCLYYACIMSTMPTMFSLLPVLCLFITTPASLTYQSCSKHTFLNIHELSWQNSF